MVSAFEDVAFAMKPGELSEVVTTSYGYHVIKVSDVKAAATTSFEDAKQQIRTVMSQKRINRAIEEIVAQQRDKQNVKLLF
jgi:parvulin-like peptidyl-prolyl isomerase